MKSVTVAGRCLACWGLTWATVQVDRHLPAAFKAPCAPCGSDELHALTGQLVPTLPLKSLRELRAAQKSHRRPNWEQLPLVEVVDHNPDAPATSTPATSTPATSTPATSTPASDHRRGSGNA